MESGASANSPLPRAVSGASCQPLAALDAARILEALPDAATGRIQRLEVAECVDSTNTVLLARAVPERGSRILLAETQISGRGRRGRRWVSPPRAHLYLSLARRFRRGLAGMAGLSLVAGIAAAEALQRLHGLEIGLKWPNDLMLQGRKLGGILVESGGDGPGGFAVITGLGINVRMPARSMGEITQPWIDLASVLPDAALDRSRLAAAVIAALLEAFDLFESDGLPPFLPRFEALDVLHGARIDVHGASAVRVAVALGVAADGGLRLRFDDGAEQVLHAGEVSIRASA